MLEANGCAVAAMPLTDITGLRDQSAPTGRAPGPNSCAMAMPAKSVVDTVASHRVLLFFMVNSLTY
jgi:hypothetical protein